VRSIDWRVTARSGDAHTKLFHEDREQPVVIALDLGGTMRFGSRRCFKSVLAAHVGATLAWAGIEAGERTGGLILGNQSIDEVKPKRSSNTVLDFLRRMELADQQTEGRPAIWHDVLLHLKRLSRPGARLFLISDFSSFYDCSDSEKVLRQIARHRQIIAVRISDVLEQTLPPAGRYGAVDGSLRVTVDTTQLSTRQAYEQDYKKKLLKINTLFNECRIPIIDISTSEDPNPVLQKLFPAK
jgi:uncharacterized protein (DUF58 family)